jgi:hypothetical protein
VVDASNDLQDIRLHLLLLFCRQFIAVEVRHDDTGQHTQQVGLKDIRNAGWVNGQVGQQSR